MSDEKELSGDYVELEDREAIEGRYYTTVDKKSYKSPFSVKVFLKTNFKMIYFCFFCILFLLICVGLYSGMIIGIVFSVKYFLVLANREYMKNRRTVIMISVDSLRYDYFQIYPDSFPNIREFIINNGVQLKQLQPVFPTKTFPNHYAIATGLLPVHNGIVGNTMYDPLFNSVYRITNNQVLNSSWYGGEPIWVTCEKQDVKTNVYFWPGSEVKIDGYLPSVYLKYDQSMPYNERIDYILGSLKKKKSDRPHLIMGYFEGVDSAAHFYGPNSIEVEESIKKVDDAIGRLWEGMKNQQVDDLVDIIIVSDHGMAPLSEDKRVNVDTFLDLTEVDIYNFGPILEVWPHNESETVDIYNTLKSSDLLSQHSGIYLKEDIPSKFHLLGGEYSRRVAPIYVIAEDEWSIVTSDYIMGKGDHGYDNDDEHMQAILVTRGPHIKDTGGEIMDSFENIHIYPLLAELLKVVPAEVDGSLEKSKILLRN